MQLLPWSTLLLAATVHADPVVATDDAPSGLLADWRSSSPALGIDASAPLHYAWIVPHVSAAHCPQTTQLQAAYQVQLSQATAGAGAASDVAGDEAEQQRQWRGQLHWDSGRVSSAESHRVRHPDQLAPLEPGTRYWWRVRTWASNSCVSAWSGNATIVTAPSFRDVKPIWAQPGARFALLRKVVPAPASPYVHGTAFVTASQSGAMEKLLGAYRLFVDGRTVAIGPGRGEARTAAYADGGDTNHTQFDSVDVSPGVTAASGPLVIGLQCYHDSGGAGAMVGMELHLEHENGEQTVVRTDSSWTALDATTAYGPGQSEGPNSVCYSAPQENIDARLFPHGWQRSATATFGHWPQAAEKTWAAVPYPKRTLPLEITEGVVPASFVEMEADRYYADFGTELMGGLELTIAGAKLGSKVQV
jgi:hypothetical protein